MCANKILWWSHLYTDCISEQCKLRCCKCFFCVVRECHCDVARTGIWSRVGWIVWQVYYCGGPPGQHQDTGKWNVMLPACLRFIVEYILRGFLVSTNPQALHTICCWFIRQTFSTKTSSNGFYECNQSFLDQFVPA